MLIKIPGETPLNIPQRYVPKNISRKDKIKQFHNLKKSRTLYKKGKYFQRPKIESFHSKPSHHLEVARKLYKTENISPSRELAKKTKCSQKGLEKIVSKGRGAYFSSGSRPNQTGESWGIARLASAITGGNSSIVDYHILHAECKPESKALRLATKTCRKQGKCLKYTRKNYKENYKKN